MTQSLLAQSGAQPIKQSRFKQIHVSKALHGEISNRFALQDPSAFIVERFYGGYQDCILTGSNIEISPRNTWWRRPGCTPYTTFDFPTPPLGGTSFNYGGTFILFVDTATGVYNTTPSSGEEVFVKGTNLTYDIAQAPIGIPGQMSYLQLGSTLFMADGADAIKLIAGGNLNPITGQPIWRWGIVGPSKAPHVVVTASGAAAVPWTASTVYTTMGLLVDSNGNVEQLDRVRTRARGISRLIEAAHTHQHATHLSVLSTTTGAENDIANLRLQLSDLVPYDQQYTMQVAPVIGTHVGPMALGLAMAVDV